MPPNRDQLLTVTDVLSVTGFKSRTTLYRRARSGAFPCPCHIGRGKIRWRSGDIEDWLLIPTIPAAHSDLIPVTVPI
ncbi:AlpA family phage regulatory protein [Novosphingobium sp. NBM11]|uniref:helix-turn-helix transcriptional regulator n=1 Tax=Novosphingobium sp. NBM11 TaxID=2596914 RepID=UPI001892448D|nr:AlpA family phage regulatory protein [Novosphingobium sp. NBM11]MBF5092012.1 AlpA family phage regulatory protein [Novosphingobium sp. NBM11]